MHRGRLAIAVTGLLFAACSSDGEPSSETVEMQETIESTVAETTPVAEPVATDGEPVEELDPTKGVTRRLPGAVGDGSPPQDVGTAIIRITDADGNVCEVCMWLADEPDERSTGLMGVLDLDQPVGMAFAWDAPTSGNFFMLNTPAPLSIAWFSPDGSYLNQTDMAPCITDDSSTCERYSADGEYDLAIEMFQGELNKVGIGPGSTAEIVQLADPARSNICPRLP